jgi:hypothetical protein
MSIQTEITNSALSAHDKEALRLERKKFSSSSCEK